MKPFRCRSSSPTVQLFVAGVLVVAALPASAASVVVPTDHATIQDAVNAVQGTAGALVTIDSDAIFDETVTITDSVTIEAGAGFTPTIRGAGVNTIFFNPNSAGAVQLTLRGVRLRPETPSSTNDTIVDAAKDGAGDATILFEDLTIEDPDAGGADGFRIALAFGASGSNFVTLRDSTIDLAGTIPPNISTTAVSMTGAGSLTIQNVALIMAGGIPEGWDVRGGEGSGIDFLLEDSVVDIQAPDDNFSSDAGTFLDAVDAEIRRTTFRLRSTAQGSANGVSFSGGGGAQSGFLEANRFEGFGPRVGSAVAAFPRSGDSLALTMTNNVVRDMDGAASLVPQSSTDPEPPATVTATLTNNTVDGSLSDAIRLNPQENAEITAAIHNNLFTNGGGVGIDTALNPGAVVNDTVDHNGYFGNVGGDTDGAVVPGPNAIFADPLYVDRAAGDYHLAFGSAVTNVGDNAAPALPATDADGAQRIQDGVVDLGAFERGLETLEVPAVGPWGLSGLGLLLAGLGLLALRRAG